jgi:hypothetical protein
MSEKILEFMNEIVNLLFNCLYVGIIVRVYRYAIYKSQFDNLSISIDELKTRQDKLFQIIIKLRNIIKVDDKLTNNQNVQLKKIRRELRKINYILDIKNDVSDTEIETKIDDTTGENSTNTDNSKNILPISLHKQPHITFPNYLVFNKTNLKQTKLPNNNYKLEFIGDNIKLISNELANFLKVDIGTCIEFDEVYGIVYNYIKEKQINNIGEDSNLCKLFGINENGDYEFSDTILMKILKELLEPHFKK